MKVFGIGLITALFLQMLLEADGFVETMPAGVVFFLKIGLLPFVLIFSLDHGLQKEVSYEGIEEPEEEGFGKSNWIGLVCLLPDYVLIFSRMVD